MGYEEAYRRSLETPEDFWGQVGKTLIHWDKPFEKVLDNRKEPFTKWSVVHIKQIIGYNTMT